MNPSMFRSLFRSIFRGDDPPPGYLIYLRQSNDGANWLLPADDAELFAALGVGFWYDDIDTPIPHTTAEILAEDSVNQVGGNAFFSASKGLSIYVTLSAANERKVLKWADGSTFDPFSFLGSTFTFQNDVFYMRKH